MSTSLKVAAVFACLLPALWSAGCGSSSTTAPSPTATSPTTDTFTSTLYVGSAVSRSYTLSTAGTVTATLVGAAPPTIVLGIGVGIPQLNGAGCVLNSSLNTVAGPTAQVTVAVDIGAYCVQVFDPGTVTDLASFTVNIIHP
jgi:hypothetical protein